MVVKFGDMSMQFVPVTFSILNLQHLWRMITTTISSFRIFHHSFCCRHAHHPTPFVVQLDTVHLQTGYRDYSLVMVLKEGKCGGFLVLTPIHTLSMHA